MTCGSLRSSRRCDDVRNRCAKTRQSADDTRHIEDKPSVTATFQTQLPARSGQE